MFPNELGFKISQLKYGDQIIVLYGEGYPPVSKDTVDIVWKVDGFSALTAGGIAISCTTISDLVPTGNHFDDFPVSPVAVNLWAEIQADRSDFQFPSEPE